LLAQAIGLRKPQLGLDFEIKSFAESGHPDRSGTDQPFAYLGDVRDALRWRVIRKNARWLTSLTPKEERILRLEQVDTTPPRKTALAKLD
jgi:hypothetical protein